MTAQAALHTALHVLLVMLEVSDFYSISDPRRRILICLQHIVVTFPLSLDELFTLVLFLRFHCFHV